MVIFTKHFSKNNCCGYKVLKTSIPSARGITRDSKLQNDINVTWE